MDFNSEENWDEGEYSFVGVDDDYDVSEEDDEDMDFEGSWDNDDFSVNSSQPQSSQTQSAQRSSKPTSSSNRSERDQKKSDSAACTSRKRKLKVEMKTVSLSNETRNIVMDTLRSINGTNFSLDTAVTSSKRKLSDRYWVNQGHLTVRNCYNYSNKKNIDQQKVNSVLLENLEKYGFYTNHCYEALVHTNNDFEKSIQFLLSAYFNVEFKSESNITTGDKSEMDDELVALKSIYENMVEERVQYKHWIFHLELPHLADRYIQEAPSMKVKSQQRTKPLCRNFSATGTCRFGSNCKFFHESPNTSKKINQENDEKRLKSSFELEIRFPDGCNYPYSFPVILFSAVHKEFSSHICLRITKYLLQEAGIYARQGFPFCYNLIDLLINSDSLLKWLDNETESRIKIIPRQSLLPIEVITINDEEMESTIEPSPIVEKVEHMKKSIPINDNRDEEVIRLMKSKFGSKKYHQMECHRKQLPAWNEASSILNMIAEHQVVVIVGETGCGKSTQIPQFILDEWLFQAAGIKNTKSKVERVEIICTQPRRISAIGVATRVAQERLERLGDVVGYQIRLESCISMLTKLLYCTTGILLKKLENDPLLNTVTHIIVDEVHERSEESDFLLLILKELLALRPNLKVILMSATLNANLFSEYFNGAPLIQIPGRMYPVTVLFLEDVLESCDYVIDEYSKQCRKMNKSMSRQLDDIECEIAGADSYSAKALCNPNSPDECLSAKQLYYRYKDYSIKTRKSILLLDPQKIDVDLIISVLSWIVDGGHNLPRDGSILVFLPGMSDITSVNDELKNHPEFSQRAGRFWVIPLHSTISNEEQSLVFKKPPRGVRKVVLSTNIAETSITIDDCVFVVDGGKMKENRFDENKNMASLETVWISRANAEQRKGRAGRVMPGLCVRLYTRHRYENIFYAQPIPEIQRVPLDQIVLSTRTLQNFKSKPIEEILGKVLEPPSLNSIETAIRRLQDIGALDEERELTALGRHLSVLPVDVKIGKLILFGAVFCCLDSVLTIAASLSNKNPFMSPFSNRDTAAARKRAFAVGNSDHLTVLNAYKKWHNLASTKWAHGKRFAEENFLSWRTLEMMGDLKHQYLDLLVNIGFASIDSRIRRRPREDKVLLMTSRELNQNGENYRLLSGIICAALYPNLVEILTPDKLYTMGVSGAIPKRHSADDLRFKTKSDGFVNLHPSSVNSGVSNFPSPYLVYQEKMKTTKVFIHDSTMVSVISLILFAGAELKIESNAGVYIASLENEWLTFTFRSLEDAKMLQHMRLELSKLLEKKIENPHLNLTESVESRIISTITDIITKTM